MMRTNVATRSGQSPTVAVVRSWCSFNDVHSLVNDLLDLVALLYCLLRLFSNRLNKVRATYLVLL